MKEYLQYYKKRENDGTYETNCYNAFVNKIYELSDVINIENEEGDFLGWRKDIFDKLFTNAEIFIGCYVWRGDMSLLILEYGEDANYWYKNSDKFTYNQKQMIDNAVRYAERKENKS